MSRTVLFALAVCLLAPRQAPAQIQAAPAPVAKTAAAEKEFTLGPEDVIDVSVWKNPELSRTVPVRPDGMVSLPLLNDIQAAGLTPTELRTQLTKRLADYVPTPEVSVIVREIHSRRIAVIGSVKAPGRYELKGPATVLDAIALAQGFTDFAVRDRIVVLRQNGSTTERIPFNYRKATGSDEQANFSLRPGDIVVVP